MKDRTFFNIQGSVPQTDFQNGFQSTYSLPVKIFCSKSTSFRQYKSLVFWSMLFKTVGSRILSTYSGDVLLIRFLKISLVSFFREKTGMRSRLLFLLTSEVTVSWPVAPHCASTKTVCWRRCSAGDINSTRTGMVNLHIIAYYFLHFYHQLILGQKFILPSKHKVF